MICFFPNMVKYGPSSKCGREDCVTCEQEGAEELPHCSMRSVLYENACLECIPTAGKKGGPREQDINKEILALYEEILVTQ